MSSYTTKGSRFDSGSGQNTQVVVLIPSGHIWGTYIQEVTDGCFFLKKKKINKKTQHKQTGKWEEEKNGSLITEETNSHLKERQSRGKACKDYQGLGFLSQF